MEKRHNILIYTLIFLFFPILISAKTTKSKKVDAEEILKKGREAFYNYDFDEAADLYDEYRSLKEKSKQALDAEFEIWETELNIASNAFDRVQRIVVVDSLNVPLKNFVDSYKIADSSGALGKFSYQNNETSPEEGIGFQNEEGDYVLYSKQNGDGELRLIEKNLLLDGEWEEKESLEGDFEKTGDYAYPFLSADGQTLYFANNGDESMGGYDIFVAQKDAITGEYRQPLNLGMPFNSPYDDMMLAIDEENGLGWWATNRNAEEDMVTIYVFLYDEIRKNYPADTDNLVALAMLSSYRDTWKDEKGEEILPIMPSINKTLHAGVDMKKDFDLSLGNGKIYFRFGDFKNRKASDMMKQYLAKDKELQQQEGVLKDMRSKYKSNKSLEGKIIKSETDIEDLRAQVKAMKSEVLRLEKSVR